MSKLIGIIQRLQALQEDNEVNERFFEVDGDKKCSVKYEKSTEIFQIQLYNKGEKTKSYSFDNIDLIAIEVYDLLQ
ncbi:DUF1797 family protein [Bacillus carboniphilus]|uniref:DUF1797 family protein n=1 Tax=Bacillus carboniphilus TaxID=86663 RepID=A0ABY9JUX5_9BACI|nr:DUF1797 family protein [Bacillus carboniphilus]WLR43196.1 DUF1797 family protein [Bacillus carboniphilus]